MKPITIRLAILFSFLYITTIAYSQYEFVYDMSDGSTAKVEISIDNVIVPATCQWGYSYKLHINYKITFSSSTHNSLSVLNITNLTDNKSTNHTATLDDKSEGEHSDETSSTWTSDTDCATITPQNLGLGPLTLKIQETGGSEENPELSEGSGNLPIELISFKANNNQKSVELNWTTATEINNNFFTIERSTDTENWEEISFIAGAGNSNDILTYSFVDNNPIIGKMYYRLKQTDYDGSFTYSEILVVDLGKEIGSGIKLYPNPTTGEVYIEAKNMDVDKIFVYDMLGKELTTKVSITQSGDNQYIVDLSNLPVGMFFIKTPSASAKVFKQ